MRLQTRLQLQVFFFENQYFWTVGVFIVCFRNEYKPLNIWKGPAALSRALSKVQTISEWAEGATHLWVSRRRTQRKEAKASPITMLVLCYGQYWTDFEYVALISWPILQAMELQNLTVTNSNRLTIFTLKSRIRKWLLKVTWCALYNLS